MSGSSAPRSIIGIDALDRRQHDRFAAAACARVIAGEAGGLSGRAAEAACARGVAQRSAARAAAQIPLIAVGGIANADDAWERIRAGASLVQLYSAMVYEGPGHRRGASPHGLADRLAREGMASISEAVGADA